MTQLKYIYNNLIYKHFYTIFKVKVAAATMVLKVEAGWLLDDGDCGGRDDGG